MHKKFLRTYKFLIGKVKFQSATMIWAIVACSAPLHPAMNMNMNLDDDDLREFYVLPSSPTPSPQLVTPKWWQSVTVIEPSKAWQEDQIMRAERQKHDTIYEMRISFEERQRLDPIIVEKWTLPAKGWFSPSLSSLVCFSDESKRVMTRRDAYEIMRYENELIKKKREELYNYELTKLDLKQATYNGRNLDRLRFNVEPRHPEIMRLWEEADRKKEEELYDSEKTKLNLSQATYNGMNLDGLHLNELPKHPEIMRLWKEADRKKKEKEKENDPEVRRKLLEDARRRKLLEEERSRFLYEQDRINEEKKEKYRQEKNKRNTIRPGDSPNTIHRKNHGWN